MKIRGNGDFGWKANRKISSRNSFSNILMQKFYKILYQNKRLLVLSLILPAFISTVYLFLSMVSGYASKDRAAPYKDREPVETAKLVKVIDENGLPAQTPTIISKSELKGFANAERFINLLEPELKISFGNEVLTLNTTLDIELQKKLVKKLSSSSARYSGIVVIDAVSGQVLAMAGHDRSSSVKNICVANIFPAASLFKIVTAAAVIEKKGVTSETKFSFNGRRHTLYKSQLKKGENIYTNRITLRDAFAFSVNPVFGKLGIYQVGKDDMEKYAEAFAFLKEIDFELNVEKSLFTVHDNSFNLAEVASGFNKETTISPLHAALVASSVINRGLMPEPTVVKEAVDSSGRVRYKGYPAVLQRTVSSKTSNVLKVLMKETVKKGTARKAFRDLNRDSILSRLDIGGKTGTIDNVKHDVRFDWFCGFAGDKDSGKKIALAVVVGHEKPKLDVRSSYYARFIVKEVFSNSFVFTKLLEDVKKTEKQTGGYMAL